MLPIHVNVFNIVFRVNHKRCFRNYKLKVNLFCFIDYKKYMFLKLYCDYFFSRLYVLKYNIRYLE